MNKQRGSIIVIALLACASVAGAEGLPLQADDGMTSDTHRKHVGEIVFSTTPIVIGKETASKFATSFKGSQPIYWRAYLPRSAANQARMQGKECEPKGMNVLRAYAATVDGVAMEHLLSVVDLSANDFARSTTWSEPAALNASTPTEVSSLNVNFVWGLAKSLSAGKHAIVLTAKLKCTGNTKFVSAPMAVGSFTLDITEADITAMTKPLGTLPRAKRTDASLSAAGTKLMNAIWKRASSSRRAIKTIIVDPDWTIEHHEITGRVISRSIETVVAYKDKDGCHFYGVRLRQDATSKGKFGETYFGAESLERDGIACEKL
ncbi:MAG: hypothetical protein ACKV2T_41075 [Kofleriaceae bacterium]